MVGAECNRSKVIHETSSGKTKRFLSGIAQITSSQFEQVSPFVWSAKFGCKNTFLSMLDKPNTNDKSYNYYDDDDDNGNS